MASLARDAAEDRAVAKAPISRHPVFPAIVALWFAALLGLGCLVLPVVLLERLVETTGLASILPAATPPLGSTARLLIALAAAVLGAGLGLLIARQVARAHAADFENNPAPGSVNRRPISAHEELGDEGLGAQPRRGLLADFVAETHAMAPPVEEPFDLVEEYLEPDVEAVAPMLTEVAQPLGQPDIPEWATAPLESLGTVQLVQRLGASLDKRRAWLAAAQIAPAGFEAAPAEEAAQARAAYFGRPSAVGPAPIPIPAYPSPADTDAALRRALATLQRMSAAG